MEIRNALATHGYAQAQQAARPTLGGDPTAPDPGTAFAEAIDGFSQTVARGEQAAQAADAGPAPGTVWRCVRILPLFDTALLFELSLGPEFVEEQPCPRERTVTSFGTKT